MFILKVLKTFDDNKIPYAIVGGLAVALHNVVRGTVDIDLIIKISKKDFVNTENILISLGLQPRLPVTALDVYNYREEYIKNKNLIAWSFYNPKNPGEIVDIIITHDLSKMKTVKVKLLNQTVSVLDLLDLIKMKKAAGRPQDLEDVKALLEVKMEKK